MRGINIFLVYLKRLVKSPSFIIAAIVIPLLIPMLNVFEGSNSGELIAGVYCEDNDSLVNALTSRDGIVKFKSYGSSDELTIAVEDTEVNCGFILPKDIFSAVMEDEHKSVICLESPSTVLPEVAAQAILSEFAKVYSKDIAMLYMDKEGIAYDEDKLGEFYTEYIDNGESVRIDYQYELLASDEDAKIDDTDNTDGDMVSRSLTGIIGVYMMLGAVLGINIWLKDEKTGIPFGIMNVVAGVVVLALFSLIAMSCKLGFSLSLALKLVLYSVLLVGYSAVIKLVFGKSSVICGILPILVLGSLVFCPIFVDLCGFVPALGHVSMLFAPHYFMSDSLSLGIAAVVCSAVPAAVWLAKNRK
jgi:hypothetical protein